MSELALRWSAPWALALALLALVVVALRLPRRPLGVGAARARAFHSLGALSLLLAAAAAAGPECARPRDRLTVVVAMDRSRSVVRAAAQLERLEGEWAALPAAMREGDRVGRVLFGAAAVTEQGPQLASTPRSAQLVEVPAEGTDLGAALRRALAELPAEGAGRLVLVSDGAENRGDALAAAAACAAAGVPVDVVPLALERAENVRVESVRVPTQADAQEPFSLRVQVHATRAGAGTLRVRVDGVVERAQRVELAQGTQLLELRAVAGAPGLRRYEVDFEAEDPSQDAQPEDDRGGAFLRVRGEPSVLVLTDEPARAQPLVGALEASHLRVRTLSSASFPQDAAGLLEYGLVVVQGVWASALSPEQMTQLRDYTRELGGGLWLLGGERGMGPGGWAGTPVEEVSPVYFDLRRERRRMRLAEVIAIDFSGSMALTVPSGETKLALANEAAARSAALLSRQDSLGVMHVDTAVHWTVPLGPVGDGAARQRTMEAIRAVRPSGGGIYVDVALAASYAALEGERAELRHVLLFADGNDAERMGGQAVVVRAAAARGFTTSVVSLGNGHDTPGLEELAREGRGRFYVVEDATRLPAVFAQETVLASRSALREEPFVPTLGAPDALTRGLALGAAPPLRGWVVTRERERATVQLRAPEGAPLLATWQAGVGRSAAFTSDFTDRWGADWLSWPEAPRLWAELARSLLRRPDPLVQLAADTEGGVLRVHAEARTAEGWLDPLRRLAARVALPDGTARTLAMDAAGAGTYEARLPLERTGAYAVSVVDEGTGAVVASGGALLLEGEELRPARDPELLARVAALTGGRVRRGLVGVFEERAGLRRAWVPLGPWLLGLASLAMLAGLATRRLARRARAVTEAVSARASEAARTVRALVELRRQRARVSAAPAPAVQPEVKVEAKAEAEGAEARGEKVVPEARGSLAALLERKRRRGAGAKGAEGGPL